MRNFFLQNFKQAFTKKFFLCALGISFLMIIDNLWEIGEALASTEYTIYYMFFNSIVFCGIFSVYGSAIVCTIPYATTAALEFRGHLMSQCISRIGIKCYTLTKYLVIVISSGACMLLGYAMFIGLLALKLPFVGNQILEAQMYIFPYVSLSLDGNAIQHILYILFYGFLTGAIWGGITVAFSVIMKDNLLIYMIPLIAKFASVQIYRIFQISNSYRLDSWLYMLTIYQSYEYTAILSFARCLFLLIACFFIFYASIKRRLTNA